MLNGISRKLLGSPSPHPPHDYHVQRPLSRPESPSYGEQPIPYDKYDRADPRLEPNYGMASHSPMGGYNGYNPSPSPLMQMRNTTYGNNHNHPHYKSQNYNHRRHHSAGRVDPSSPMYPICSQVHLFLKQMIPELRNETIPTLDVIFYRYENGTFEQPNGFVFDTSQSNKERQTVCAIIIVPYDPVVQYGCCEEEPDWDSSLHYPFDRCSRHHHVESIIVTNYDSWVFLHKDETNERHHSTHSATRHHHSHQHSNASRPPMVRSSSMVNPPHSHAHRNRSRSRDHEEERSLSRPSSKRHKQFKVMGVFGRLKNRSDEVPELLIDSVKRAYQEKSRYHHQPESRGRRFYNDNHHHYGNPSSQGHYNRQEYPQHQYFPSNSTHHQHHTPHSPHRHPHHSSDPYGYEQMRHGTSTPPVDNTLLHPNYTGRPAVTSPPPPVRHGTPYRY